MTQANVTAMRIQGMATDETIADGRLTRVQTGASAFNQACIGTPGHRQFGKPNRQVADRNPGTDYGSTYSAVKRNQIDMHLPTVFGFVLLSATLSACGQDRNTSPSYNRDLAVGPTDERELNDPDRVTIWDALEQSRTERAIGVNRYLWAASLDVLNFLPVEEVDPFTGVIIDQMSVLQRR